MRYEAEGDLKVLESMASNLTPYLYESEVFGTIAPNLPKLTVGGLLLRLHRLQGVFDQLSKAQQQRFLNAKEAFENAMAQWAVHYEGKIGQEIKSRLGNYNGYIDDHRDDQAGGHQPDPSEATHRTILQHLREEAQRLGLWTSEFNERLGELDQRMRRITKSGSRFTLAPELQSLYPAETYWWLYGPSSEK
jgi:hypothetical protein